VKLVIRPIIFLLVLVLVVVFSIPIYVYCNGIKHIESYLDPPTTVVPSHILAEYKNWLGRPNNFDYRKLNPYSQTYYLFSRQGRRDQSKYRESSDQWLYSSSTRIRLLSWEEPISIGTYKTGNLLGPIFISRHWTANQMIAELLDKSYYGNRTYGYEDASDFYFGVTAEALTKHQLFALFHIIESPARFDLWCDMEQFKFSLESRLERRNIEYELPPLLLAENLNVTCKNQ